MKLLLPKLLSEDAKQVNLIHSIGALPRLRGFIALLVICHGSIAQETDAIDAPGNRERDDARFVPAELSFAGGQTIEELVEFPETESDVTVVLLCALLTGPRRVSLSFCSRPDDGNTAFNEAFRPASWRLRATAARIDGRVQRRVWIPYSVEFSKRGNDERVQIHQNYGAEAEQYGKEYVGPQRVIPNNARSVFSACRIRRFPDIVCVSATITADGRPENIRVASEATNQCREKIEALFLQSAFIPAHVEGTPVAAEFIEPFFSNSR